jgi:hypothetical protein
VQVVEGTLVLALHKLSMQNRAKGAIQELHLQALKAAPKAPLL